MALSGSESLSSNFTVVLLPLDHFIVVVNPLQLIYLHVVENAVKLMTKLFETKWFLEELYLHHHSS